MFRINPGAKTLLAFFVGFFVFFFPFLENLRFCGFFFAFKRYLDLCAPKAQGILKENEAPNATEKILNGKKSW